MRRYNIDYLRLLGIFLLFPFHSARVFDPFEANYVENAVKSMTGVHFMATIWPWFMPLMFLVAGISTWYSMAKRSGKQFLQERVIRLFIPLLLGIIIIVPIQGYMSTLQQGTINGGYFNYLITKFFTDWSDISGYRGTFTPAHLWFILFLFVFSLVFIRLFIRIKTNLNQGKQKMIERLFKSQWFLLLLFIPLTISEALPDIGGKNPFFYALYYLIGFCLAAYGSFEIIVKMRWKAFAILIISLPLYFVMMKFEIGKDDFAWQSIIFAIFRNLYGLSFLYVMMAFTHIYLNKGGKVLNYFNKAAYPIYILHQSVMMVVAYFIVQWQTSVTIKFSLIVLFSLAFSILLYEIGKRFFASRFILGIK